MSYFLKTFFKLATIFQGTNMERMLSAEVITEVRVCLCVM